MRFPLVLALGSAALFLGGCGGGRSTVRVSAGGATFVDPLMQKWSGEYRAAKGVEIDYVAKGSGYGISNVISRTLDFGCTDAPMTAKEVEKAGGEVVHVPVAIGAVAIVFNLPGVADLKLTGEVLADIYLRKVTTWNDPRIAKLNPGVELPAAPIAPIRRKESSGTTNIFTEYLSKRSPEFAQSPGTSKDPKWPEGVEGKPENAGIAEHVKNTPNSIGYVELAFARKNHIPVATLVNRSGKAVAPDAASVTAAVNEAMKAKAQPEPYSLHPLTFSFTDAEGEAAYPIVGASYAIFFKKQPKDKGTAIVDFLKWAVTDGQKFTADLDYAPLPGDLAQKCTEILGAVTLE